MGFRLGGPGGAGGFRADFGAGRSSPSPKSGAIGAFLCAGFCVLFGAGRSEKAPLGGLGTAGPGLEAPGFDAPGFGKRAPLDAAPLSAGSTRPSG